MSGVLHDALDIVFGFAFGGFIKIKLGVSFLNIIDKQSRSALGIFPEQTNAENRGQAAMLNPS